MTIAEEILDLAAMLLKKAKLADAKAALHRHQGEVEEQATAESNAAYCRRKAAACEAIVRERRRKPNPTDESEAFQRFWNAYPRKVGKATARAAWVKLKCDALAEKILGAVERAQRSPDWTKEGGAFIPFPATWLNREGWEDELVVTLQPKGGALGGDPAGWAEWLKVNGHAYTGYRFSPSFRQDEFNNSKNGNLAKLATKP